MPTPAPIRATLSRVRARALSRPYGPSTRARVPGRSERSPALPSPTAWSRRGSVQGVAPVGDQDGAGGERRRVAGEVDHAGRDLLGRGLPPHRRVLDPA